VFVYQNVVQFLFVKLITQQLLYKYPYILVICLLYLVVTVLLYESVCE